MLEYESAKICENHPKSALHRMNILHVLSQFEVTGAEAYAASLVEQQVTRDHRLFVVSDTLTLPFRAICLNVPIGRRSYAQRLANIRWLVRFIRQHNIQIVHAHSRAASWVCYVATRLTRTPYISTVHGRQHIHTSSTLFNIYGKNILAVCPSIKEHLVSDLNIPADLITVVPNGFSPALWNERPRSASKEATYGVSEKTTVWAFVGRLTGPKGDVARFLLHHIIPPLQKLRRFTFFIIGGTKIPADIPRLVDDVNSSGQTRSVILLGYQKNIRDYLSAANLVFGSGRVAIEALLLGKPVVAFGESQYIGLVKDENLDLAIHTNFGDAGKPTPAQPSLVLNDLQSILKRPPRPSPALVRRIRSYYTIETVEVSIQRSYERARVETLSPKIIPVLLYHRVVSQPLQGRLSGLAVTVEQFERQLKALNDGGFTTITFSDYAAFARGERSLPERPVILTFDDGYEDNYTLAYPLLCRYNMSAVIYLVADWKKRTNFWDHDQPQVPLLKPTQIREMARAGIEFGSHSLSHPRLPSLPKAQARKEISNSKTRIEDLLGAEVLSFAYPYALMSEQTKELVSEAGYRYAVVGDNGPPVFYKDPLQIRRVQVFPWTGAFGFWKKTQPWYYKYKDLKR